MHWKHHWEAKMLSLILFICCIINRFGSYIHSPDWIKSAKAKINLINKKYNKSFQYAVTVALNHKKNWEYPERITKNKAFINKNNWQEKNLPSEKDD